MHPKKRDIAWLTRKKEHEQKVGLVLAAALGSAEKAAKVADRCARPERPTHIPAPPLAAWKLAQKHRVDALERLERTFDLINLATIGGMSVEPVDIDSELALFGLPLLGSLAANGVRESLLRQLTAIGAEGGFAYKRSFRRIVSGLLFRELDLWLWAKTLGAMADEMPYAYRYSAYAWLWSPEAHERQLAWGVCLRCGILLERRRRPSANAVCAHCANESQAARRWPNHTIAPAGRGTWWLECQREGCSQAFLGRANRHFCPAHPSAALTSGRRLRKTDANSGASIV